MATKAIRSDTQNKDEYRTELQSDKRELRKDYKALYKENKVLNESILALSVEKTRLEGVVDSFQKDMKSLQQTKWSRKIGAGLLTFCGAVAPLFMFYWWSIVVYYCLIVCAVTSIFWGVLHCRVDMNTSE